MSSSMFSLRLGGEICWTNNWWASEMKSIILVGCYCSELNVIVLSCVTLGARYNASSEVILTGWYVELQQSRMIYCDSGINIEYIVQDMVAYHMANFILWLWTYLKNTHTFTCILLISMFLSANLNWILFWIIQFPWNIGETCQIWNKKALPFI